MQINAITSLDQRERKNPDLELVEIPTEVPLVEETLNRSRVVPHIDHKLPRDEDGMRRSPNPISGNYATDLWRSHTRSGGVPSLVRSRKRVGGRNDCEKLESS